MPEKFKAHQPLADINVTPLVDVMLVLLVIFMVTAPMFSQGLPVTLPEAPAPALASEQPLVISISRERTVYLGEREVGLAHLQTALAEGLKGLTAPEVLLKADQEVPYGIVVQVMSVVRQAGVVKLGIVTAPHARR